MPDQGAIIVHRCGRCGDIARFDITSSGIRCRVCRGVIPMPINVGVIADDTSPLETQLARSNPTLWNEVQARRGLRIMATHEAREGVPMKRGGPSWRRANLQIASLTDGTGQAPVAADRLHYLRTALERWESLSLAAQRDLLRDIDQHARATARARRAQAFLIGISPTVPDRWWALRHGWRWTLLYAMLTAALLGGRLTAPWLAVLMAAPSVALAILSWLLHAFKVRQWLQKVFLTQARQRGIDASLLLRLHCFERAPASLQDS